MFEHHQLAGIYFEKIGLVIHGVALSRRCGMITP
jgi:hypothetical protein